MDDQTTSATPKTDDATPVVVAPGMTPEATPVEEKPAENPAPAAQV